MEEEAHKLEVAEISCPWIGEGEQISVDDISEKTHDCRNEMKQHSPCPRESTFVSVSGHQSSGAGIQSSLEAEEESLSRQQQYSNNREIQQSVATEGSHSLNIEEEPSPSDLSMAKAMEPTQQQEPSSSDAASEELRHSRLAILIFCIVALNIGAFLVTMYMNDCPAVSHSCFLSFLRRFAFQPLKENPLIGPSSETLERVGALDAKKVRYEHQGWRLITCIWLHAGVVHVFVNMLSLLFVGVRLEQEFGPVKIAVIYLLSGLGGSLLSVLFLQGVSVGASGALFGLVGAMLAELFGNWTIYINKCAVISVLLFVVAGNLAMGILPFVDNFAHIGGLVIGFLSGLVLLMKPQYGFIKPSKLPPGYDMHVISVKAKYNAYQYTLWITALILLIAGITSAAVLVFQGVDGIDKCKWCHYLSCVPTSSWKCRNSNICNETQVGNMLQIICTSNNKSSFVPVNQTQNVILELCSQLCS